MSDLVEVVVGRIGRAHGIRGDIAIEVRTDEPERRFADGARLRIDGSPRTLVVARSRLQGGRLVVGFDGVADRTAAEALRGALLIVDVPADERPDDDEGFYDRQLLGLRVRDHEGTDVGVITGVVHLPGQDLLEVRVGRDDRFVPFVTDLVPEVDLAGGFVRLAPVDGLLEDLDD